MNVASLELCKCLYELSGWDGDEEYHGLVGKSCDNPVHQSRNRKDCNMYCKDIPAYDLGYLLKKLPRNIEVDGDEHSYPTVWHDSPNHWGASYYTCFMQEVADTPEDAVAKLAIELFKQGILKRGES